MKIFITGGTGQLGHELTKVFKEEDLLVGKRPEHDVTDEKIIDKICEFNPDIVIHAGAYTRVDGCETNPELAHRVNAVGSYHVASGAEKCRAKLVYLSTDYVFNGEKDSPYVETDDLVPLNAYGQSKLEGEQFVQQTCPHHIILRTSWVYGNIGNNFVKTIEQKASGKEPIRVVNDQTGCPTYAKDLALAISAIIKLNVYGIFHAAGQGACTWFDFATEIIKVNGLQTEIQPISSSDLDRPARRPRNSVLSQEKLNALGIALRPWQEALADFIHAQT